MFLKHTKWALLWALFILILCGIPGRDIPHISFLELLSFDKFVHAGIFCVLVMLLIRGFYIQVHFPFLSRNARSVSLVLAVMYGGILEIMQGTVFEERSADLYDFVANSIGCFVALGIYNWTEKIFLSKFIK